MDPKLKAIVERMTQELRPWLDEPSPAAEKIKHLRTELAGLKAELGAGVLGDTLKQLERAEAETRRLRQREAAEAVAEVCRPLGVTLEAREPPKRKARSTKAGLTQGGSSPAQK